MLKYFVMGIETLDLVKGGLLFKRSKEWVGSLVSGPLEKSILGNLGVRVRLSATTESCKVSRKSTV